MSRVGAIFLEGVGLVGVDLSRFCPLNIDVNLSHYPQHTFIFEIKPTFADTKWC